MSLTPNEDNVNTLHKCGGSYNPSKITSLDTSLCLLEVHLDLVFVQLVYETKCMLQTGYISVLYF